MFTAVLAAKNNGVLFQGVISASTFFFPCNCTSMCECSDCFVSVHELSQVYQFRKSSNCVSVNIIYPILKTYIRVLLECLSTMKCCCFSPPTHRSVRKTSWLILSPVLVGREQPATPSSSPRCPRLSWQSAMRPEGKSYISAMLADYFLSGFSRFFFWSVLKVL